MTTPKFPPPPRSAQYRWACSSALGADLAAVGEHHVRLEQVVDRQTEGAREVPEPAAERESADAGGRDDAARRREPVLAGRAIDLAPRAAAADAHGPRLRVDLDVLERGEVDHHAVVAGAETGAVVAAAADRDRKLVLAGEGDRARDVVRPGGTRDQRGPAVDHRVVDGARVVVAGVAGLDQPAAEPGELLAGVDKCAHTPTL